MTNDITPTRLLELAGFAAAIRGRALPAWQLALLLDAAARPNVRLIYCGPIRFKTIKRLMPAPIPMKEPSND